MPFFGFLGLLEEERLASAHQAETFTRQIQRLQGEQKRTYKQKQMCIHLKCSKLLINKMNLEYNKNSFFFVQCQKFPMLVNKHS